MSNEKESLVRACADLLEILDTVEESDEGREFHPTTIQSCRTQHVIRLNEILAKMREECGKP